MEPPFFLFRELAGLADGLAPKERRYVAASHDSPQTTWVPRFRYALLSRALREFSK
jgi:hypothetical protein